MKAVSNFNLAVFKFYSFIAQDIIYWLSDSLRIIRFTDSSP